MNKFNHIFVEIHFLWKIGKNGNDANNAAEWHFIFYKLWERTLTQIQILHGKNSTVQLLEMNIFFDVWKSEFKDKATSLSPSL